MLGEKVRASRKSEQFTPISAAVPIEGNARQKAIDLDRIRHPRLSLISRGTRYVDSTPHAKS